MKWIQSLTNLLTKVPQKSTQSEVNNSWITIHLDLKCRAILESLSWGTSNFSSDIFKKSWARRLAAAWKRSSKCLLRSVRWNAQKNKQYMLCSCVLGKFSFLLESVPSSNFIKFLGTWHFSLQIQLSNLFMYLHMFSDLYLLQSLPSVQSVFRSSIRNHQERATRAKHMGHLESTQRGQLATPKRRWLWIEIGYTFLNILIIDWLHFSPSRFWMHLEESQNNKPEDCFPFLKFF